jgi:hypothetical protein
VWARGYSRSSSAASTTRQRAETGTWGSPGSGPLDDSWFPGQSQTASAPGTTPGSSGGGGGGGAPNLAAILGGDPLYQQYLADLRAQGISDRAGLRDARQRSLVNFGEIPNFRSLVGGNAVGDIEADITPEVRSLAEQATTSGISTRARIDEARKDAARQLTGYLVGKGLLRSGETGFQQNRQQTEYTRANYDATQQLLDFLGGAQSSYTQAEQARKMAEQQAAMSALQGWLSMNPNSGGGGPSGSSTPSSTTSAGLGPAPSFIQQQGGYTSVKQPNGTFKVTDRDGDIYIVDENGNIISTVPK